MASGSSPAGRNYPRVLVHNIPTGTDMVALRDRFTKNKIDVLDLEVQHRKGDAVTQCVVLTLRKHEDLHTLLDGSYPIHSESLQFIPLYSANTTITLQSLHQELASMIPELAKRYHLQFQTTENGISVCGHFSGIKQLQDELHYCNTLFSHATPNSANPLLSTTAQPSTPEAPNRVTSPSLLSTSNDQHSAPPSTVPPNVFGNVDTEGLKTHMQSGLASDALILLDTLPDKHIPGVYYDIASSSVLITGATDDLLEKNTTKFQDAYQGITAHKIKKTSVELADGSSEPQVRSLVEKFRSKYTQCAFVFAENAVKIVSSSSRSFDAVVKLVQDELRHCTESGPPPQGHIPEMGPLKNAHGQIMITLSHGRTLTLKQADIVKEQVDVIVNAANKDLLHGGGVAGAIDKASHGAVQRHSHQHVREHGTVSVGQVAVTRAGGNLKCSHVFHAVGPTGYQYSNDQCHQLLMEVTFRVLQQSERYSVRSVAIPAISSGIYGVDKQLVADGIISSILIYQFQSAPPVLSDIRIVIIDKSTYSCFAQHLIKLQKGQLPQEQHRGGSSPANATLGHSPSTPGYPPSTTPGHVPSGTPGHPSSTTPGHPSSTTPGHPPSGTPDHPSSTTPGHPSSTTHGHPSTATPGNPTTGMPDHTPYDTPTGTPGHASSNTPDYTPSNMPSGSDVPGHPPAGKPVGGLPGSHGSATRAPPGLERAKSWPAAAVGDIGGQASPPPLIESPVSELTGSTTEDSTTGGGTIQYPHLPSSDVDSGDVSRETSTNPVAETNDPLSFAPMTTPVTSTPLTSTPMTSAPVTATPTTSALATSTPMMGSVSVSAALMTSTMSTAATTSAPVTSTTMTSTTPVTSAIVHNGTSTNLQPVTYDPLQPVPEHMRSTKSASSGVNQAGGTYSSIAAGRGDGGSHGRPPVPGSASAKRDHGQRGGRNTHGYGQDTKAMSGHPERKGNRVHSPTSGTTSNSSTKHHNRGQGDKEGKRTPSHSAGDKDANAKGRRASAEKVKECPVCLDAFKHPVTTKCGHMFCRACFEKCTQHSPFCPTCRTAIAPIVGNQPHGGTMTWRELYSSLPGYPECSTIEISYSIPSGIQSDAHLRPGVYYIGTQRYAYLPHNYEGWQALMLLKRAFDARLVFTVGDSVTTSQQNVVVWNDIHHKTQMIGGPSNHGYPDSGYLRRLMEDLAAKGICPD